MAALGVGKSAAAEAEAEANRQIDALWLLIMGANYPPLAGQMRQDALDAARKHIAGSSAHSTGLGYSGGGAPQPATPAATRVVGAQAFSALHLPASHGLTDADIFTQLANGAGVTVKDVAGMLAGVRGRSTALSMGNSADTLVGMAVYDFEAIVARVGTVWPTMALSWQEAAQRLQILCADFETRATEGGQAGAATPEPASQGWAGEDERSSIPASANSERATSANVVRLLGSLSTITAEAAAIRENHSLVEARRRTSNVEYGHAAAAFLISDGSSTARVGPKGEPTPGRGTRIERIGWEGCACMSISALSVGVVVVQTGLAPG
jgi:hypothetical protein